LIDRATVTLNGASIVNPNGQLALTVSQSVLSLAGNLTANGTLNWANGTMSGTGIATISHGGVPAIGSSGLTFDKALKVLCAPLVVFPVRGSSLPQRFPKICVVSGPVAPCAGVREPADSGGERHLVFSGTKTPTHSSY
jgi:hypothetical protein